MWLPLRQSAADPDADLRAALERLDLPALHAAADTIGDLAREPDEDFHAELLERYATIRRFLPKLLKVITFDATGEDGRRMLQGVDFLASIERRRTPIAPTEVPATFLTGAWLRRVFPKRGQHAGGFDKLAYTVAVVERLRESMRRHQVFVPGLRKWGDPAAGLIDAPTWNTSRTAICRDLARPVGGRCR